MTGAGGRAERDDPVWMSRPAPRSLAEIHAVSGPGAGRVWPLGMGVHDIGSAPGSAIEITGDGVPERGVRVKIAPSGHAWLVLPDGGDGSREQGSTVRLNVIGPPEGGAVPRCSTGEIPWPTGGDLVLGEVVLQITSPSAADAAVMRSRDGPGLDYNRPVRVVPPAAAGRFRMPDPPAILPRSPVPAVMTIGPILMGIGLVWLLNSFFFLIFVFFSSVFAIVNWANGRRHARRTFWSDLKVFWDRRVATYAAVRQAVEHERTALCDRLMDPARAALTAIGPGRRLWERRRGDADYLVLRVGTVDQPSMIEVEDPAPPDARRTASWTLPDAPFGLDLTERGVVGLAGQAAAARAVAGWMVAQAAVLHSPRDVQIYLLTHGPGQAAWDWVRLLPHVRPAGERRGPVVLAGSEPPRPGDSIAELVSVISARSRGDDGGGGAGGDDGGGEPDVIVVVDGARRFLDVAGMAQILAEGPAQRVFSICLDERERSLPGECTAVVRCGPAALTIGRQDLPEVTGIRPDLVTPAWCVRVAGSLAALRDVAQDDDAAPSAVAGLPGSPGQQPPDTSRAVDAPSTREETLIHLRRAWPLWVITTASGVWTAVPTWDPSAAPVHGTAVQTLTERMSAVEGAARQVSA